MMVVSGMAMGIFVVLVVVAVVVAVVMMVMMAVSRVLAQVRATLRRVRGDFFQEGRKVALQSAEAGGALACALLHVEAPVYLDLQAVATRLGIGECAHQLDALVGVVHLYLVAEGAQRIA